MTQDDQVVELPPLPEGATLYEGPDDHRCRVIKADGTRCNGTRSLKLGGRCPGHGGAGIARSPEHARQASKAAAVERTRRAEARIHLGVSARRAASPLQAARVRAQMRADELAAAIVDGPLDDAEMSALARQGAAIKAVEVLYPQTSVHLDVDVPTDEEGVQSMGWQQMQALAATLLGDR